MLENMLYPQRDAATFAILMIAFPLLERYLRQKAGLTPNKKLSRLFFAELIKLFPPLKTEAKARDFWNVFRDGILHQVTVQERQGARGQLSHDLRGGVTIDVGRRFIVDPVDFARRVTKQIEDDFLTFEGAPASAPPLATKRRIPVSSGSVAISHAGVTTGYILGTDATSKP